MSPRMKQGKKVFNKSKKRICTTVISHVNRNEPNNTNTSKNDNLIVTSNLTHINVQTN